MTQPKRVLMSRIEKAAHAMAMKGKGRESWDLMGRWELWAFCQVWY